MANTFSCLNIHCVFTQRNLFWFLNPDLRTDPLTTPFTIQLQRTPRVCLRTSNQQSDRQRFFFDPLNRRVFTFATFCCFGLGKMFEMRGNSALPQVTVAPLLTDVGKSRSGYLAALHRRFVASACDAAYDKNTGLKPRRAPHR
jgi:hypothetical protein